MHRQTHSASLIFRSGRRNKGLWISSVADVQSEDLSFISSEGFKQAEKQVLKNVSIVSNHTLIQTRTSCEDKKNTFGPSESFRSHSFSFFHKNPAAPSETSRITKSTSCRCEAQSCSGESELKAAERKQESRVRLEKEIPGDKSLCLVCLEVAKVTGGGGGF